MDLGEYLPCLNVANLQRSIDFYEKLDFRMIQDHRADNWAVLQHSNMVLCLFEGHIEQNLINFRGGDIQEICQEASSRGVEFTKAAHLEDDESWSAEVFDPDGNCIYFNTFQDERIKYMESGKLIE